MSITRENYRALVNKLGGHNICRQLMGAENVNVHFTADAANISHDSHLGGRQTISLGELSAGEMRTLILSQGMFFSLWASAIMDSKVFKISSRSKVITPKFLTVHDLGFRNRACLPDIFKQGEEFGCKLCAPEAGPLLRLKLSHQAPGTCVLAMKPIEVEGKALIFNLTNDEKGLSLGAYYAEPNSEWLPETVFVFHDPCLVPE